MFRIFIFLIRLYQFFSKFFPGHCRFFPTCSEYAAQSLKKYGVARGIFFSIRRILRCHPLHPGGYDPVN